MTSEERIEFIITSAETLAVQLRELNTLREQVCQAQKALTRQTLPKELNTAKYH
jgi:predicted DNA-binding protein (UPF0251 family)